MTNEDLIEAWTLTLKQLQGWYCCEKEFDGIVEWVDHIHEAVMDLRDDG